jgi:hypothetical protein
MGSNLSGTLVILAEVRRPALLCLLLVTRFVSSSTLKQEVVRYYETSVNVYHTIQHRLREASNILQIKYAIYTSIHLTSHQINYAFNTPFPPESLWFIRMSCILPLQYPSLHPPPAYVHACTLLTVAWSSGCAVAWAELKGGGGLREGVIKCARTAPSSACSVIQPLRLPCVFIKQVEYCSAV